jgi:hypothetical protein
MSQTCNIQVNIQILKRLKGIKIIVQYSVFHNSCYLNVNKYLLQIFNSVFTDISLYCNPVVVYVSMDE